MLRNVEVVEVEGWTGWMRLVWSVWVKQLDLRFLVCWWHPWISMNGCRCRCDSCIFLLWGLLGWWFLLPSQRTVWLLQWLPRPPLYSIYLLEFSFPERVKLLTSLFFGNQYNTRVILLPTPNKCTYFSGNSWKSLQIAIDSEHPNHPKKWGVSKLQDHFRHQMDRAGEAERLRIPGTLATFLLQFLFLGLGRLGGPIWLRCATISLGAPCKRCKVYQHIRVPFKKCHGIPMPL